MWSPIQSLPSQREIDLRLFNNDRSFHNLIIADAFDCSVVLLPLCLIGAAICAILYLSNVLNSTITFGTLIGLGALALVETPFVVAHIVDIYRYRNQSLNSQTLKQQLQQIVKNESKNYDEKEIQQAKKIASKYQIELNP